VGWVVVDVMPDTGNRRAGADRRLTAAPDVVIERRRAQERRVRARPRVLLGSDLERGWLYFQMDADESAAAESTKRRLAPIPPGWESLPDAELALLLARARQVTRGGRGRRAQQSAEQAELS
jgi:hypothetical protein